MRTTFIKTVEELAAKDRRIFFITADLGFGVIENFQKRFPKQFLNVGVAEQDMIGIAAGLALSGKIVFVYSIGNFPTLRALEHVRNDICYNNANVKIVCVGGGFSYGALGATHHATEDLAILRTFPRMIVVAPGDPVEVKLATKAIAKINHPCYLRLNRSGEPPIHSSRPKFQLGKAILVKKGSDITLISTGALLANAVEASKILEENKIHVRLLQMHTLKPLDKDAIRRAAKETKCILTIEEHTVIGGLGGAVAEVLAESGANIRFARIGIPDTFSTYIGDQEFLRKQYGLSPANIAKKAIALLQQARTSPRIRQ